MGRCETVYFLNMGTLHCSSSSRGANSSFIKLSGKRLSNSGVIEFTSDMLISHSVGI